MGILALSVVFCTFCPLSRVLPVLPVLLFFHFLQYFEKGKSIVQTIKNVPLYALEKCVSENEAECIDIGNGSLIDNFVYSFSFGTMFCFETFCNEWTSEYTILFFHKDRERGINKAWERFNALKNPV